MNFTPIGTIRFFLQNDLIIYAQFLTEYGLYEVLMQSRKPIARQFKRKVKGILRELRRTGKYDASAGSDTLPGGCTLDGEPVITVKLAAAHFGVDKKAILNALSDKSGGIVKGIDYLPARSGAFLKFRAQNPGIVYGNTPWLTLIRLSGFRKLETRFRRTIGYSKIAEPAPVPVADAPAREGTAQEVRRLAVPQPPALPPAREPEEGTGDAQTWIARARAQATAFGTLLRSYERTGKAETRHGAAVAMEEAAEAILAAARGMKSAAGEG